MNIEFKKRFIAACDKLWANRHQANAYVPDSNEQLAFNREHDAVLLGDGLTDLFYTKTIEHSDSGLSLTQLDMLCEEVSKVWAKQGRFYAFTVGDSAIVAKLCEQWGCVNLDLFSTIEKENDDKANQLNVLKGIVRLLSTESKFTKAHKDSTPSTLTVEALYAYKVVSRTALSRALKPDVKKHLGEHIDALRRADILHKLTSENLNFVVQTHNNDHSLKCKTTADFYVITNWQYVVENIQCEKLKQFAMSQLENTK